MLKFNGFKIRLKDFQLNYKDIFADYKRLHCW